MSGIWSIAIIIPEKVPSSFDYLASEAFHSIDSSLSAEANNEARLLTTVYTELGLFNPDVAEMAPVHLAPAIDKLLTEHKDKKLEPFVAMNLNRHLGLRALVELFDRAHETYRLDPFNWDKSWEKYGIDTINSRRADGGEEPGNFTVRGHDITFNSETNSPGLRHTNKSITTQREAARGAVLLNVVDWLMLEARRRELDASKLNQKDITRFPQMHTIFSDFSKIPEVGAARLDNGEVYLHGSLDGARESVGIRFSVGNDES